MGQSPIFGDEKFEWPVEPSKLLESLADKTDALMYVFDGRDRLVIANENTEKFIGHELEFNARLEDHLAEDVAREMKKSLAEARRSEGIYEVERSFSHNGRPVWLSTRLVALDFPATGERWVFGLSRDVTEEAWERVNLREAKQRLDFISEHAGDIIALISADGYTLWLNKASERLTGYPLKDFAQTRITDLEILHPEDRPLIENSFREMLENPGVHKPGFRVKRKDGKWVHLEGISRPVFDKDGNFTAAVVVLRDITRLREAERKYRFLAEHAHDLISIMDTEGQYIYVSPSSFELLGYSPEYLSSKSIFDICHHDETHIIKDNLRTLAAGKGETYRLQHQLKDRNGNHKHFESIVKAFTDPEDSNTYIQCTSRDITDRKKMEEALIASHKMTSLGTLAGGIAHEFNNLHSIILSHASFLINENDMSEEASEDVKVIIDASNRASKITRELATYAQVGVKNLKKVDLNKIVKNTLNIVSDEFSSEGVEVIRNPAQQDLTLKADKGRIQQVIMHLFTNATHSMTDSDNKKLTIETGEQNEWAYVKVSDSGIGIEPDKLQRVFDPFYTTKGPLGGSTIPGTGLGLSVCNSIIREHGGVITVESEPGVGSTFTVWLPLEEEEEKKRETPEHSRPSWEKAEESSNILVVDDEPSICEMVKRVLQTMGHQVETATRGEEAVEKLEQRDYDLVLLDLQMPDMPGENLIRAIQEKPPGTKPAFIVITGKVETDRNYLLGQGAFDVLEKPFHMNLLGEKVEQVLRTRSEE